VTKGGKTKLYLYADAYEGTPPRLYRTPGEIRRDMTAIANKIKETESMLSVHNILLEMIPTWAEDSPERWIPELSETVAEAEEALENLKVMKEALEELSLELGEVLCMMRR
jgi:hypothetical protein